MPGIEVIASDAGDVAATKMLIEGKDRRTRIAERHECVTYRVVMHSPFLRWVRDGVELEAAILTPAE